MTQPESLLPGGAGSYRPPALVVSQTEDVRVAYAERATASLLVQASGLVTLNAEAARWLPAGDGTIDLRPPVQPRAAWHLDCRPGGHYRRLPSGSGGVRFKAARPHACAAGRAQGPLRFYLEPDGNGLFRLYTESVHN